MNLPKTAVYSNKLSLIYNTFDLNFGMTGEVRNVRSLSRQAISDHVLFKPHGCKEEVLVPVGHLFLGFQ